MTQYVTSDLVNKRVTFTSKNVADPVVWIGKIAGVINYDTARRFGDVLSYNASVQHSDSAVGDASVNTYFILALDIDANGQSSTQVFANEWISTFSVIDDTTVVSLDVYDINATGKDAIITLLRSAGYTVVAR